MEKENEKTTIPADFSIFYLFRDSKVVCIGIFSSIENHRFLAGFLEHQEVTGLEESYLMNKVVKYTEVRDGLLLLIYARDHYERLKKG